jgi:hypothetical protein
VQRLVSNAPRRLLWQLPAWAYPSISCGDISQRPSGHLARGAPFPLLHTVWPARAWCISCHAVQLRKRFEPGTRAPTLGPSVVVEGLPGDGHSQGWWLGGCAGSCGEAGREGHPGAAQLHALWDVRGGALPGGLFWLHNLRVALGGGGRRRPLLANQMPRLWTQPLQLRHVEVRFTPSRDILYGKTVLPYCCHTVLRTHCTPCEWLIHSNGPPDGCVESQPEISQLLHGCTDVAKGWLPIGLNTLR